MQTQHSVRRDRRMQRMDETITLADGTVIACATGRPVRKMSVMTSGAMTGVDPAEFAPTQKRDEDDLPDVPGVVTTVMVVAGYVLYGFANASIARVTGLTVEQVVSVRDSAAFCSVMDALVNNVLVSDRDDVRRTIAASSRTAAKKMHELMGSEDERVSFVAAKDILDRSGHRPADVVDHNHRLEGGLVLEIVRKGGDGEQAPVIDVRKL